VSETIGEQLREARSTRQITLEQAAKATHIRQRFLEALENNQWDILPSKVQGRGFLRLYADYLGLNVEAILNPTPAATASMGIASPEESPELPLEEALLSSQPDLAETESHQVRPPSTPNTPGFVEIGRTLRQRREAISLSLTDVERYTRLRARYLQALEEGRIYDLPSPVQGRGMLSNYAAFLGLDSEEILNRFAEELQNRLAQRRPASTQPGRTNQAKKAPTGWRRIITVDVIVGTSLVLGLMVFAFWGFAQIAAQQSPQEPTPPSISDILMDTRTPLAQNGLTTPTNTPQVTVQAQATATIPFLGNEPLQVYIVARQRAWLQVIEDNKVAFSGRVVPGTAYPFTAINSIEVYCGSSSALQIYFNQTELNTQGRLGQTLELIFTAQGIVTPTPRFTATPTATPQPTATLQPTRTQAAPTITPLIP
jgi:cytoskeleton protein RodZ